VKPKRSKQLLTFDVGLGSPMEPCSDGRKLSCFPISTHVCESVQPWEPVGHRPIACTGGSLEFWLLRTQLKQSFYCFLRIVLEL